MKRNSILTKAVSAILAGILTASLAACGGSTGSTAPTRAGETTAAASKAGAATTAGGAASNGNVIKIGWLAPLTGQGAENGQQVTWAAEMIVDLINKENPDVNMLLAKDAGLPNLNGAKIQLVEKDTKGDTTVATSAAKQLISEDGCVAITGQLTSSMTKAIAVVTEQYQIPLVTAGSAVSLTDGSNKYDWLFRYNLTDATYIDDSFKLMDEQKKAGQDIKSVAFLSEDSEFGANIVTVEVDKAKQFGYDVVQNMTYASNSTSLSSEVMKLKSSNPDVLMVAGYASDVILLIKTMKDQGWFPKMLIGQRGGFVMADFFSALGSDTEYIMTTGGWADDLKKECIQSLEEIYPKYSNGIKFNEGMSKDCADVLMIASCINQAGSTEPTKLKEALLKPDVDFSKVFMPWTSISMNENGQNTDATGVIMQVQGGKYVTVYPTNVKNSNPIVPAKGWKER